MMKVVSSSWGDEGPDWNVGDWRDTISIPAPGNVTVRWRADDFTGEGDMRVSAPLTAPNISSRSGRIC